MKMVKLDSRPICNVVFVVEATANVGAYFDGLKSAYILPTLEYFNGGPPQELDYACPASCTLYTLVTFHGSDVAPASLTSCYDPTTSTHQFSQLLDSISFASGRGDFASHMSEGLSTVAQVFDDLAKMREPNLAVQKHCILVCNSAPYGMVSQDSRNYAGRTTEQLISFLAEHNVNFSIISPRKIPVLYHLFDLGSGDMASLSKNYTVDSRHLVLLKGFQLQERPLSPGAKKEDQAFDALSNIAAKPSAGLPGPMVAQPRTVNPNTVPNSLSRPQLPQTTGAMNTAAKEAQKILTDVTARNRMIQPPTQTSMMMTQPQQQQQQQQQPPMMMPGFSTQMRRGVPPHQAMGPQVVPSSMMSSQQAPSGFSSAGMMGVPSGNAPGMMIPPQPIMDTMPSISDNVTMSGPGSIGVDLNNPAQPLQAAAMAQQQRTVWTGLLEFAEKQKPGDTVARTLRSIPTQLMASVDDPDINTSKWPDRLSMNFIPQIVLTPLQTLIKDHRTVTFHFNQNDPDAINSLNRHLSGYFGCINIPTVQDNPHEVRILVLIYSSRKRQFVGLIPKDQARFITGFRTVITKHKVQQGKVMANAFGGPGTQPVMAASAQMLSGGQVQQTQQPGTSLDEQDRRNTVMQFQAQQAMAVDQQRQQQQQQQILFQQQHMLQQQRAQQQQQQHLQQSMNTNQPLRHLLLNPQQQQLRQQQQVQVMLQHRQRGTVPQTSQNVQSGLQPPGMVPQMQPGQNFGQLSDDMNFD